VSESKDSCSCGSPAIMILPCSGSADVGLAADKAARVLSLAGDGKMSCLAGIGARLPRFLTAAKVAARVLVIDGCPIECAARCMQAAGCDRFTHLKLHELGFVKGAAPATDEAVKVVVERARALLAAPEDGAPKDPPGGSRS
jgi:uncharacterized metal-binding protein